MTRLSKAIDNLASLGDGWSLDASTDPVSFIEKVAAEVTSLRERLLHAEALIANFAVPHDAMNDETTPTAEHGELMASWHLAVIELVAYYHDSIIGIREGTSSKTDRTIVGPPNRIGSSRELTG